MNARKRRWRQLVTFGSTTLSELLAAMLVLKPVQKAGKFVAVSTTYVKPGVVESVVRNWPLTRVGGLKRSSTGVTTEILTGAEVAMSPKLSVALAVRM